MEIKDGIFKGTKFEKWGIETKEKESIIPFEYDSIEDFKDGRAKAQKNSKFGYIDEEGQTLIPFEYDSIEDFKDGKAKAKKNFLFGYIDEEGQTLIPFEYDSIEDFIDGRAKAKKTYTKFGYIDEEGQTLIPFVYDSIGDFIDGRAKARKKIYKWGVETLEGNLIIPFEYDSIEDFIDGKAKARKNRKFGYIDEEGQTLIPFEYDSIEDFVDGKAKARKDGEYALIDCNGDGLIVFKEKKWLKGKYGETINEYLFGIKDTKGNIIVIPKYNKIDEFKNGIAKIYGDKKYVGGGKFAPKFIYKVGYINETGKIVAQCVFDEISEFIDGKAKAKKNGKDLVIDIYGNDIERKNIDLNLYQINSIHNGKIINLVNFGIFVELGNGKTALLHITELNKHNQLPTNYTNGEEIEVQILNIDENKNRISLTLPWKERQ